MIAAPEDVTERKPALERSSKQEAAAELVRQAKERGLYLTGPDGLLKQLTKSVIETALGEEMNEHPRLSQERSAAWGVGERAQRVQVEDRDHGQFGAGGDRRAPRPDGPFRTADRQEASALAGRGRQDRSVAVCQGAHDRGNQRAFRRDLRGVGVERDDLEDHRSGA
jgi:hypothetical protein